MRLPPPLGLPSRRSSLPLVHAGVPDVTRWTADAGARTPPHRRHYPWTRSRISPRSICQITVRVLLQLDSFQMEVHRGLLGRLVTSRILLLHLSRSYWLIGYLQMVRSCEPRHRGLMHRQCSSTSLPVFAPCTERPKAASPPQY